MWGGRAFVIRGGRDWVIGGGSSKEVTRGVEATGSLAENLGVRRYIKKEEGGSTKKKEEDMNSMEDKDMQFKDMEAKYMVKVKEDMEV